MMTPSMNWLDTETKAILQKIDEPKMAPPKAAEVALIMIRRGTDRERLVRAICRINECHESKAIDLLKVPVPVIINSGLTEPEALFGQFELICCDAIAAFIRSAVALEQCQRGYLEALFNKVSQSPEFEPTRIEVLDVPPTDSGEKFVDQFLGLARPGQRPGARFSISVPYKKARIMKHWARRIGAKVKCDAVQVADDAVDSL